MPDWPPAEGLPDLDGMVSLLPVLGVGLEGVLAVGRDGVLLTLQERGNGVDQASFFRRLRYKNLFMITATFRFRSLGFFIGLIQYIAMNTSDRVQRKLEKRFSQPGSLGCLELYKR